MRWGEIPALRFVGRLGQSDIIDAVFRAELEGLVLGEQREYGEWSHEDQLRRHPRDSAFEFAGGGITVGDWGSSTAAAMSTDTNPAGLPELPPFPVPVILRPSAGRRSGLRPRSRCGYPGRTWA